MQVVVDGRVVARRDRGGAPTVALLGTAISARDPDGDPLTTVVEASSDRGVTWSTIVTAGDPATIRALELPRTASGAGRLRVTVSDGFDRTTATSGPLTFKGAAPSIRIAQAPPKRIRRGDDVTLTAVIAHDAGGTIRWLDGKRRIATGTTLSLGRLPAGRHVLRATVSGVRSKPVRVTVRPRPPLILLARRSGCRIRLATDVPVTVRARGRVIGRLPGNGRARTLRACRGRLTLTGPLGLRGQTL